MSQYLSPRNEYHIPAIRKLLNAAFNDEDFMIFCYDYFENVYQKFGSGMTFKLKVHSLIEYCKNNNLFDELLLLVKEVNPSKYDELLPSLIKDVNPSKYIQLDHSQKIQKVLILLIGHPGPDPWYHIIKEVSDQLGTLWVAHEVDTFQVIRQQVYDLIVIDAAKVNDAFRLTSSLRLLRRDAKIVVVTASPTWRRAREAFRAGATDYIRKSMDSIELLSVFQTTIIDKILPPWQH